MMTHTRNMALIIGGQSIGGQSKDNVQIICRKYPGNIEDTSRQKTYDTFMLSVDKMCVSDQHSSVVI